MGTTENATATAKAKITPAVFSGITPHKYNAINKAIIATPSNGPTKSRHQFSMTLIQTSKLK